MSNNASYTPKHHIAIIEAARGFAALYVVQGHILHFTGLHNALADGSWLKLLIDLFIGYSHQAVILFFVLSGFSIHYASVDRHLTNTAGLKHYYYLRWRRIYPIFIVAVLLTILLDIAGAAMGSAVHLRDIADFSSKQLVYTLTFLTDRDDTPGVLQAVMHGNGALWSLSYEVFYYLIYPVFWLVNRRFGLFGSLTLGITLSTASFITGELLGAEYFLNVLDLYIIWCLGAVVAEMHRRNLYYKAPMLFQTTAIYILLQSGWVLKNAVNTVGAIADITWGALFFFIMLLYINKNKIRSMNHWQRGIALATATGGYIFIIICVEHLRFIPDMTLFYIQISLTLLMFAIGLYWSQLDIFSICNMLLQWFYRFGKISYSIYIIHQPILMIIIFILLQFGDPAVLVVLFVPAILYLAWFLELRYQPFMLSILNPLAIRLGMMPRDKTIS